jgi:hypothetical protein
MIPAADVDALQAAEVAELRIPMVFVLAWLAVWRPPSIVLFVSVLVELIVWSPPPPPDPHAAPAVTTFPFASNFAQSSVELVPVKSCTFDPFPWTDPDAIAAVAIPPATTPVAVIVPVPVASSDPPVPMCSAVVLVPVVMSDHALEPGGPGTPAPIRDHDPS